MLEPQTPHIIHKLRTENHEYDPRYHNISLTTFLQLWALDRFTTGSLGKYILRSCRNNDGFGSDRVIYFYEKQKRRLMIRWRLNIFGFNRTCLCGEIFQRTHVDRCFDRLILAIDNRFKTRWNREKTTLNEPRYTLMDSLLNNKEYEIASALLQSVKQLLTSTG